LSIALKHAEANQVSRIISIQLKVGELSDLEDEWMQKYFDYLSRDTIAGNAKLEIERMPVTMQCDDCEHSFSIDIRQIQQVTCPECAGSKCTLTSGREYHIKDMKVI